jgi:hypothetical protein
MDTNVVEFYNDGQNATIIVVLKLSRIIETTNSML